MAQEPQSGVLSPKLSLPFRAPPPTPVSAVCSSSFFGHTYSKTARDKPKKTIHLSSKKRKVICSKKPCEDSDIKPNSVSVDNTTTLSVFFTDSSSHNSPVPTPTVSSAPFDSVEVKESNKSRPLSKSQNDSEISQPVELKSKRKCIKKQLYVKEMKVPDSFRSPPNPSPTISLITLPLHESCHKSETKCRVVDEETDKTSNGRDRKVITQREKSRESTPCSEKKTEEKKSTTPPSSSMKLESGSPANETNINTTTQKYWSSRLLPQLNGTHKDSTLILRVKSAKERDAEGKYSCWQRLEAIYGNAGACVRVSSTGKQRSVSCPEVKQKILACPAFVQFSIEKNESKVAPAFKSLRLSSSEGDASSSPCATNSRVFDRSIPPAFKRHIKETWTNSLHSDRSDSDIISKEKSKFSKRMGFDRNREKEPIEPKGINFPTRERVVRFSVETPPDSEETDSISEENESRYHKHESSSKEKHPKASAFRNRQFDPASKSDGNPQKLDSTVKPTSALKRVLKYFTHKKSLQASFNKLNTSKGKMERNIRLTKEEKPSSFRKKERRSVGEKSETFLTDRSPTLKIKIKPGVDFKAKNKYAQEIETSCDAHGGYHKNKKQINLHRKTDRDRQDSPDSEISSDKISSSNESFSSTNKHSSHFSSNSDRSSSCSASETSRTPSTSSVDTSSSREFDTKFENQSDIAATIIHDEYPSIREPMTGENRNSNHSRNDGFNENRRSVESNQYVNRGSSPVKFASESLQDIFSSPALTCPSSAKSKSACNFSSEVDILRSISKSQQTDPSKNVRRRKITSSKGANKVMYISTAQQTVPCVNLHYLNKTAVAEKGAEGGFGRTPVEISPTPTTLIPNEYTHRTFKTKRRRIRQHNLKTNNFSKKSPERIPNLSADTCGQEIFDTNSTIDKQDRLDTSSDRNLENSKISQYKQSINNNTSNKTTLQSIDSTKSSCAIRENKSRENSGYNTKPRNSARRETFSTSKARGTPRYRSGKRKRCSFTRPSRRPRNTSSKSHQTTNIYSFTTKNESITVKFPPELINSIHKQRSLLGNELRNGLICMDGRQTQPKIGFYHREPSVESKLKYGNTSTTQIEYHHLNDESSLKRADILKDKGRDMRGKSTLSTNSKKPNPIAQSLKYKSNISGAKGQKDQPKVPFSCTQSNAETHRRSRSIEETQGNDVTLKSHSVIEEILKYNKIKLGTSNEGKNISKDPSPSKVKNTERTGKPGNSNAQENKTLREQNSLSAVEESKYKTNLIENERQSSNRCVRGNYVESKFNFSNSSSNQLENKTLNKPNQVKRAIGGRTSSNVSLQGTENTIETKLKPCNNSARNIEDIPLKEQISEPLSEWVNNNKSQRMNNRHSPLKVSFSGISNSVDSKPQSFDSSAGKFEDQETKDKNSTIVDRSFRASGMITQSKLPNKVNVEDEKCNSRTVSSTKRKNYTLNANKRALKTQNTTNSNSQNLKTMNVKKGPSNITKIKGTSKPNNTDVKSPGEQVMQANCATANENAKSSRGPKLLGSENINSRMVPTNPSSYTVNTCLLPGYQAWPSQMEEGHTKNAVPPMRGANSRDIVCFPQPENALQEVYYAVPVKFPFIGNSLGSEDRRIENFRGRSQESLNIDQRYHTMPKSYGNIFSPPIFSEGMNNNESNLPVYGYQNERNCVTDPANDMPQFLEMPKSNSSANGDIHRVGMGEENNFLAYPISLPVASCPAFSAGTSFFPNNWVS